MKLKESFLWFLLLIFLFTAGYLKGYLPESQVKNIIGDNESVLILTTNKNFIPAEYLLLIEESAHLKIRIDECLDWQDCSVRMIANPSYYLIFVDNQWMKKLIREGLVSQINPLKKELEANINPDFLELTNNSYYFLPVCWEVKEKLYDYGFAIPRSTPNRMRSLNILKTILNPQFNLTIVKLQAKASTFKTNENDDLLRVQKASYLRELNLKKIIRN